MAITSTYLVHRPLVTKFSLFIGVMGVVVLLLQSGEASPRPKNSRNSRSLPSPIDSNDGGNGTMDGSDDKLCSAAGGSDQPRCRKAGLDMKNISLELIKLDILKKLRLDANKLPNVSAQNFVIPPRYLNNWVEMPGDSPSRDDNYDDEHATTEKIIAFSKPEHIVSNNGKLKNNNLHYFTFSEKMANMQIKSAKLYVHVKTLHHEQPDKKNVEPVHIRIMERLQTKENDSPMSVDYGVFKPLSFSPSRQSGSANGIPIHGRHHNKWVEIDIRDALSKWLISSVPPSARKITLAIDAVGSKGNPHPEFTVVSSSESDVNTQYPFIEVQVDAGRSRQPRNIGMTCDENSKETRCCKYPLTVDFEEFGWDWIIAPKKYDANYCSGECPFAFLQQYPHNHIVQQAVPSGVGGPCCAARKMSSISMLYFDGDSNIVYSVLPGMVVEKCGCS